MARSNGKGYRRRDFQRSKVYRAERDMDTQLGEYGGRLETIPEIRTWIDEINGSRWMKGYVNRHRDHQLEVGHTKIVVGDGRSRIKPCAELFRYNYTAIVKFPKWGRSRLIVLHELTHVYTNWIIPAWHGREFCANYLEFVKRWLGQDARAELQASFQRNGVKFRRKKPRFIYDQRAGTWRTT